MTSALNLSASVQISNVKHSIVLSIIYHDQMDIMEQESTNFLMSIETAKSPFFLKSHLKR